VRSVFRALRLGTLGDYRVVSVMSSIGDFDSAALSQPGGTGFCTSAQSRRNLNGSISPCTLSLDLVFNSHMPNTASHLKPRLASAQEKHSTPFNRPHSACDHTSFVLCECVSIRCIAAVFGCLGLSWGLAVARRLGKNDLPKSHYTIRTRRAPSSVANKTRRKCNSCIEEADEATAAQWRETRRHVSNNAK
jgi:hypothetical protein